MNKYTLVVHLQIARVFNGRHLATTVTVVQTSVDLW